MAAFGIRERLWIGNRLKMAVLGNRQTYAVGRGYDLAIGNCVPSAICRGSAVEDIQVMTDQDVPCRDECNADSEGTWSQSYQ